MAFFTWDEKYRVGIASIDQQHQHLFELISNFHATIRQKDVKRAMSEILKGLIEYAGYHFATDVSFPIICVSYNRA
jgi:hemerythrin